MQRLRILFILLTFSILGGFAQQAHYTGNVLSNPSRHDGGLTPIMGVHNIQILHADNWKYNHQPMMAYWNGKFYVHYLSDPVAEHIPPSVTYLQTSEDGYHWSEQKILFPEYSETAVMHQRVGWYVSSEKTGKRLIAIGNYGICENPKDDPNDGNGIGRVAREINPDGSFGPIYFIYYNHNFNEKNTKYPFYTKSKDKKFRLACDEILANPLYWMQFVEECDRNDIHLPVKEVYKAFNYYQLPDSNTLVAFWKHALTSQSNDGGKTWSKPIQRAKGFVNSNAKIWGQRLSDGTYATVYNPSEYRWPLAISSSADGIEYTTLNLINGEISPMRHGGQYKSFGPQYVRGILPGNGTTPDGNLWIAYSMNKEDMWVSRIPVPLISSATEHAHDDFQNREVFDKWNIYSPVYAPIKVTNGWLEIKDNDEFDYARAERVIPESRALRVSFDIIPKQQNGELEIELLDKTGNPCTRIQFQNDGALTVKVGARYNNLISKVEANKKYGIVLEVSLENRNVTIWVNGKKSGPKMLFAPIESICRVCFRTGKTRTFPTPDTPADTEPGFGSAEVTKPNGVMEASWTLNNFISESLEKKSAAVVLSPEKLEKYTSFFNEMEDETIVQSIPNDKSLEWLKNNIALFECPDKQIEEIYYYRWWTLRKHIKETPMGLGMTEFLVNRSYADKWNLIPCAMGHHIMETRWLKDPQYFKSIANIWLRGNTDIETGGKPEGGPMKRIDTFSSWLPYAMWQAAIVSGDFSWFDSYKSDLLEDIERWEKQNSYGDGLFWSRDVKDGMEESISGGRKVNNRRPTINSYMWGNYVVLGLKDKADSLKIVIEERLWNKNLQFYGTLTESDSLANVRELIGYLPWYFNMPEDNSTKYQAAWMQLLDKKGFDAPFGMTTAERRHPLFRKKYKQGKPTCEWDGAIWPFATSQTLTALANVFNNYPNLAASLPDTIFFHHLKLYTESQYRRGRPYIGEYLDEKDGQWLMGDRERSRYYNHSTYNDLIITGLVGLRPEVGNAVTVNPLVPKDWRYFCLDGVPYHGHLLTIVWDADGSNYHQGQGLSIFVDGKKAANCTNLNSLSTHL